MQYEHLDDSDIEFKNFIESGGQAKIYLARSISRDEDVIIKEFEKGGIEKELLAADMKHDNIVKFIGSIRTKPKHLVYEFINNGDLERFISKEYALLKMTPLKHIKDILTGLQFVHDKQIVHLDLHPRNILVHMMQNRELILKICDFGLSEKQTGLSFEKKVCGRPGYVSPEKLTLGEINVNTDIWSFGGILWKLLTTFDAYNFDNKFAAYYNIGQNKHPDVPLNWPVLVQKLFFFCWDDRKTTTDLLTLLDNNRIARDTDLTLSNEMPLTYYKEFVEIDPSRVVSSIEWESIDKKLVFKKYCLDSKELNCIKQRFQKSICKRKFVKITTMMDLLMYLNENGHILNLVKLNESCIGQLCVKKKSLIEKATPCQLRIFARVLGIPDVDITQLERTETSNFVNEIFEFWSDSSIEFSIEKFRIIIKQAGIDI